MTKQEETTADDEALQPTPFELEQTRHAKVAAVNAKRERLRLAAQNRKNNHPAPRVGDTFFVSPARGIKARGRAGVRFADGDARTRVDVVDESDDDVLVAQRAGKVVVNLYGAEQILADTALTVHRSASVDVDNAKLRERLEAVEAENKALRDEQAAARKARMAAKDSDTGAPSRLPAARTAVDEFGGKPAK